MVTVEGMEQDVIEISCGEIKASVEQGSHSFKRAKVQLHERLIVIRAAAKAVGEPYR